MLKRQRGDNSIKKHHHFDDDFEGQQIGMYQAVCGFTGAFQGGWSNMFYDQDIVIKRTKTKSKRYKAAGSESEAWE